MRVWLVYLAGLLTGISLLIFDELLTFAMYCGRGCQYPYPLIGSYDIYTSSYLPFSLILLAFICLGIGMKPGKPANL